MVGFEILSIPRWSLTDGDISTVIQDLAQEANHGNQQFRWLEGVVDADGQAIRSALAFLLVSQHVPNIAEEIAQLRTVDGLARPAPRVQPVLSQIENELVNYLLNEPVFIQEESPPLGRTALEILIGAQIGFLLAAGTPLVFIAVPAGIFAVRAASAAGEEAGPAAGRIFKAVGARMAQWISRMGNRRWRR